MFTIRLAIVGALAASAVLSIQAQSSDLQPVAALFKEWRSFEEPPRLGDGVPDYTPATNAKRLEGLRALQSRLAALDRAGWTVPQQVDYHLVRAEMNGMEYHLRVLQPFARDPRTTRISSPKSPTRPSKEGPVIHGAIKLFDYPIWPRTVLEQPAPLTGAQAGELATRLQTIPPLLKAARANLASANARDLWLGGVRAFEEQSEALATLRTRVGGSNEGLSAAIVAARTATDEFAAWLRAEAPKKTGPSGIGKEHYTWYLRNVLLVPLSWEDEVAITKRELARARRVAASRGEPKPAPATSRSR